MAEFAGYQIFQAGYRLGCLEDLLRASELDRGKFYSINRTLSQVAVRSSITTETKDQVSIAQTDEYFLGRIALGILQRGITSFASPDVERSLIDHAKSASWEEWTGDACKCSEGEIRFGLRNPSAHKQEAVSGFEVLALSSFESRAEANWSREFGSTPEALFYRTHLATLLGAGLALIEGQRPISSMIDPNLVESEEFANQRVDFAVESPTGAKIVFEIDGGQHEEQRQKDLDRRRDNALRRSGWHIERIKLIQARFDHHEFSKETVARIGKDDVLGSLQQMPAISRNLGWAEADILDFVLASHAVARTQLACLLALISGNLSLDAPEWNIVVVERDARCSLLAVSDLACQLHHLATIYGTTQLPPIRLAIFDQTDDSNGECEAKFVLPDLCTIDAQYVERDDLVQRITQADLVVDVAVRARQSDEFQEDGLPQSIRALSKFNVEIRTAYRGAPEQFIPWPTIRPRATLNFPNSSLSYFLGAIFRKTGFRPLQENVVARALSRKSLIGLLPTGSGKSITFQLPALLSPGAAIVICPLKSLMDDQVDNLASIGIDRAVRLHSGLDQLKKKDAIDDFVSGLHRFLYVSPERFQIQRFRTDLASSRIAGSISLIVVDEAHCVSEWGHDFRPAYLNVGQTARQHCTGPSGQPPIAAVTGTASQNVLSDIQRGLDIELGDADSVISSEGFDREELSYLIFEGNTAQKRSQLGQALCEIAEAFECFGINC